MEILWNQTSRKTWDRLTSQGAALQQDWAYGASCEALGSSVLRAEIRDGVETLGVLQLIHRPFFGLLHAVVGTRGPVWLKSAKIGQVSEGLRQLSRTIPVPWLRGLFLTPDQDDVTSISHAGFRRVMTSYATVELDLTTPTEVLRTSQHQKWRNRLAVAEAADLTIRRLDARPELYRWLLEAEQVQQARNRYRALPPALVPAWQASRGRIRVYAAERNDQIVAAMLFLIHGDRATYHIGWINPDGRRCSAHNLLLWHAVRKLPKAGGRLLDLGGINTHDSPGIARFKLGTGGNVRSLCGTWFAM
ncbi:MAG: GNAT family N-acetyltransferase [Pseudomonadota bacterium]